MVITNMQKWILSGILIIYFVFTSGLVFELTKSESVDKLDTPYSSRLSAERTGIVGVFTEDDIACAEWLAINTDGESPIYADINGFLLLTGHIEPYTQLQEPIVGKIDMSSRGYIFLTEWNIRHDKMVLHSGQSGFRVYAEFPEAIQEQDVIFKSGAAVIYR